MPHDETYLLYMLIACRRVSGSVAGITRAEFDANPEKMDSVALQVGNVGEAASHITEQYKKDHPEIPWKLIVGMRHRVFHGYQTIDWDKVWTTAAQFVPDLILQLEHLVPTEE